jgi:inorganic triphosphatase YgiF
MEIELKLTADRRSLPELRQVLRTMSGRSHAAGARLQSIYYDTPDFALRRRNMTLRVRRQNRKLIQTIKSGEVNGTDALARHEWEDEIRRPQPDLEAPHAVGKLPAGVVADALRPAFATDVERTTFLLNPTPETEIEAAVDEGEIRTADGKSSADITEIELELKRGEPSALYDVALQLADKAPLRIGTLTKAERGYFLADPESRAVAVRRTPVPIKRKMTLDDAIAAIGRQCLSQVIRNEAATLAGDPEGIHQARVAIRRLRSFLSAVKPSLPAEAYRRVTDELKWLGNAMGDARNWDVFTSKLLPPVADAEKNGHDIDKLEHVAEQARDKAHEQAEGAIRSDRYTRSLLDLGGWFESRGWRDQPVTKKSARLMSPVHREAPRILKRQWRQVRKRSRKFKRLDTAGRHKLRIAIKKMRYTTEFLAGLFGKDDVKAFTSRLKPLQDELGHLNDVRMAHRLLEKVRTGEGGDASAARGVVLGWYDHNVAQHEPRLRKQVRKVRRAQGFW